MPSNLIRTAGAAGLLALALSACGSGGGGEAAKGPAAGGGATTDKIDVKDFAFKPDPATVKVGTAVTWTFSDDVDHNVEGVGESELKKSPDLKGGKTYAFTFTKPGEVKYRCSIHNSMTGSLTVTA